MEIGCQDADDAELPELSEFPEAPVAKRRLAAVKLSPALSYGISLSLMTS